MTIKPCVTPRLCQVEQRRVASINNCNSDNGDDACDGPADSGAAGGATATDRRDAGQWVYHDGYEGSHPQCPRRCDGKGLKGGGPRSPGLIVTVDAGCWKLEARGVSSEMRQPVPSELMSTRR